MRSSHKHQMSRHDLTTGDRHKGGCFGRVEAPVAFNKHQDRSAVRGRAGCVTSPKHDLRFIVVLPVELGRAFGLGSLSRGWAA